MKRNYQSELDGILDRITIRPTAEAPAVKPSLLLHACCAPCSSYVIEYLASYFDISIYYYNPNIHPRQEYERRLHELESFLPRFPPALENRVRLIRANYDVREFEDAVRITENPELASEAERGERCRRCYELRIKHAYEYAREHSFDWFTTTLSISPFKDADKINDIGEKLEASGGPRFLTGDFKKRNGFKRSLEISKEYGMYRQEYCGCKYSLVKMQQLNKV
ncbi:epoxyqueuosine reductase QueH [Treponema socranskii]|uniref:epoxyqueuosine reductase QueH n=1 Tax=Treponema TaxID=157 RepID=UPI00165233D7|nr:epoxyqueuosine reductase QueH [Treponema sp. Marseille-Q4130]MBC6721219.1 epoxyqueuosine reductase QueH [Treponema sp. Marseille-Q4130]